MRIFFLLLLTVFTGQFVTAQQYCSSYEYEKQEMQNNPELLNRIKDLEKFILQQKNSPEFEQSRLNGIPKIIIPVVVHIIYHQPSENISDEQVYNQINVLNNCFRRLSSDTIKTPIRFLARAADCEIEFQLAISDPKKRATNGIVRKYTPVAQWDANDKVKYTLEGGDDVWDPSSYMNIWVCNLRRTVGYASFPGGLPEKDGLVIGYNSFGLTNYSGYDLGKTAVHEAGHWLGLKHIWGDAYCGDDLVDDTPKQGNFTTGSPTGIRISCSNAPDGDMYMNYMDLCADACTNLFTIGQKERMLANFKSGGARYSIKNSTGLMPPTNFEIPLPEEQPKWQHPQLYPNPATTEIVIDVSYDIRWVGKSIVISNSQGQTVLQETISGKIQRINISKLKPGIYFINSKKDDGAIIKSKFIKM